MDDVGGPVGEQGEGGVGGRHRRRIGEVEVAGFALRKQVALGAGLHLGVVEAVAVAVEHDPASPVELRVVPPEPAAHGRRPRAGQRDDDHRCDDGEDGRFGGAIEQRRAVTVASDGAESK